MMSYEKRQDQRITNSLEAYRDKIKGDVYKPAPEGKLVQCKKVPDIVEKVYDLALALNGFASTQVIVKPENDQARWDMLSDLMVYLAKFIIETSKLHPDTNRHAQDQFEKTTEGFKVKVQETITKHYKQVAAEDSWFNDLKDLFNEVCKLLHLRPKATLDSSTIIQSDDIKKQFNQIKHSGIVIEDEDETSTQLGE
jgi:hypothetical protein